MDKTELKRLAELSVKLSHSKKMTIELVRWAAAKDGHAEKLIEFLEKKPEASQGKIRYEMAEIVLQEMLDSKDRL